MKFSSLLILFLSLLNIFSTIRQIHAKLDAAGIVGGKSAKLGQFKYQVSVQVDDMHCCGGGIISDQHILAAAHCVLDLNNNFIKSYFSVVAGSVNAHYLDKNALRVRVEYVYVPKEFNIINFDEMKQITSIAGDIAVLKLETPLNLGQNSNLMKLNLPKVSNVYSTYENMYATVAGFGLDKVTTKFNPFTRKEEEIPINYKGNLRYFKALVIANDICINVFNSPLLPGHICAQVNQNFLKKGGGICKGDSGSPLVLDDNTVIGIVSTGPLGCDEKEDPSVYTRVTDFMPFLHFALNDINLPSMRVFKYNLPKE